MDVEEGSARKESGTKSKIKRKRSKEFLAKRHKRLQLWKAMQVGSQQSSGVQQKPSPATNDRQDTSNGLHGTSMAAPNVIETDRSSVEQIPSLHNLSSDDCRQVNDSTSNVQTNATRQAMPAAGVRRMVIIDGNNVAFSHSNKKHFSVAGIDICIKYFRERGYDCRAIVPKIRLTTSNNPDLLDKLVSDGTVVFTPCKHFDDGTRITSNVDRFILDFAGDFDAAVVSNDDYMQLSTEGEKYKEIVGTRVIGFTFLNDTIRFPQDPYGRFGPTLDGILNGREK